MPLTSLQELIDRAIFAAHVLGEMSPDDDPVSAGDIEGEVWASEVFGALADQIAEDAERRHLLMATRPITLTSGIGTLPNDLLTEHVDEGTVRDAAGNVLVKVHQFDDFLRDILPKVYGYYSLQAGQIHTRNIGTGDLTTTAGPLLMTAPFVPSVATIGQIPDALVDDCVTMLAARIRFGVLATQRVRIGWQDED